MPWMLVSAALAHPVEGTWVLDASTEEVRATLDDATARATAEFNFLIRPVARQVLGRATNLCGVYAIAMQGQFELRCDDNTPLVRPLGRERTSTVPADGSEPFEHVLVLEDQAARLTLYGEHGERRNVYAADGDRLTLHAEVVSTWLDTPMTWTLSYRRAP